MTTILMNKACIDVRIEDLLNTGAYIGMNGDNYSSKEV